MDSRFVDEALVEVCSGNGGRGVVHFRREKYVPRGGPDGGDGGDGGDVLFLVRKNLKTLSHLKMRRVFRAQNGQPGGVNRRSGRRGRDVVIPVPPGTLIKDPQTRVTLNDLSSRAEPWLFLRGGKGGRGNWHFRSSTRQVPRVAEPGGKGACREVLVELALIADVGLVGKPNAGKSTLLSVLTNSRPRIGAYPFTTKIPNIGVCRAGEMDVVIADIPGIIEGAAGGAGLGLRFLKHITRTRVLVFLLDLSEGDPAATYRTVAGELAAYDRALLTKSRLLVGTKLDILGTQRRLAELAAAVPEHECVGVSAVTGQGVATLKRRLFSLAGSPA